MELIDRFNQQIVTIVNLLCKPGERDTKVPGLNPKQIAEAVRSCYQEEPTEFMSYRLYDMGAYPEPAIFHKMAAGLEKPQQAIEPGKAKMGMGLMLHKLLPQTNCQKCGKRTCLAFAIDLGKGKLRLADCPALDQPDFAENRRALAKLLQS